MTSNELTCYRVDHLGLVAQMVEDLGIVTIIDSTVGYHSNEIVTTGQAAAAMVTMALGFVSRPMYLSPQFFESKALPIILGSSKTGKTNQFLPEHFNDDKLGRTLDEIYDIGPDALFQTIAFAAARKEKLKVPTLHEDTTTHSFYGLYDDDNASGINGRHDRNEPCHAVITYGFNKDNRSDCKQIVQELLVSSDGDVPLMTKIHSGNASDVKVMQERIAELKKQFADAKDLMPEYIVADSKFYNAKNVKCCDDSEKPKWITRVPDGILEVRESFDKAYANRDNFITIEPKDKKGSVIQYQEFEVERDGVKQKFVVVVSSHSLTRAQKTLERQIKAECVKLTAALKKLEKRDFACEVDASNAVNEVLRKATYHKLNSIEFNETKRHSRRGRPSNNSLEAISSFRVSATFIQIDEESIEYLKWKKAFFVVGTNDINADPKRIICIYRKDQQGVEKAFRFLKSPTYFAEAFFLKNTKRIVALITIMTISLLVYSLLQRKLRMEIEKRNIPIPNQLGKPTKTPTLNWVNQCFEGIDVICHRNGVDVNWVFVRMNKFTNDVLKILGQQYVRRYSLSMLT